MSEQKEINKPKLIRAYLTPYKFRVLESCPDGKSDGQYIKEAYTEDTEQADWFVVKTLIEEAVSKQMQAVHKRLFKEIEEILKESWHVTNRFVRDQICKTVQENFEVQKKPPKVSESLISENKEARDARLRVLILKPEGNQQ